MPHEVVVLERHGALLLDDDPRRSPQGADPVTELFRVGDGGGQTHDGHGGGQVDQHLLPDRPAIRVLQVVHLVHHDRLEPRERVAALVQHVAQHLGRHDDDRRLTVDRVVPGQQPHPIGPVGGHEIAELLVGQRLERRGVEAFASRVQRPFERELRDHRLARARGGGHQHRGPLGLGIDRLPLEGIQRELVALGERCRGDHAGSVGAGLRRHVEASYGSTPQAARWPCSRRVNRSGASTLVRWPAAAHDLEARARDRIGHRRGDLRRDQPVALAGDHQGGDVDAGQIGGGVDAGGHALGGRRDRLGRLVGDPSADAFLQSHRRVGGEQRRRRDRTGCCPRPAVAPRARGGPAAASGVSAPARVFASTRPAIRARAVRHSSKAT